MISGAGLTAPSLSTEHHFGTIVSTTCLPGRVPLAQRLEDLASIGVRTVELGGNVEITTGWLDTVQGSGLRCLLHGYFPSPEVDFVFNLASSDRDIVRRSIEHAKKAIDISQALDAPFYSLHAGFVTDPVRFDGASYVLAEPVSGDAEASMDRFTTHLSDVVDYAASKGVQILVENNVCQRQHEGKVLMHCPDEIEAVLSRTDLGDLALLLDTGHLRASAATIGFDFEEAVRRIRGHVGALHLHDNDGCIDQHRPFETAQLQSATLGEFLSSLPVTIEARFDSLDQLSRYKREIDFLRNKKEPE